MVEPRVRPRFVLDTMLGRLARWLRAMGYDSLYLGPAEDRHLLQLARNQTRILVTRDRALARLAEPHSCLIRGERVDDQILEAVQRLALCTDDAEWLSRCLECNTPLHRVDREEVFERVPPFIYLTQERFATCPSCNRVFWHGTHADEMLRRIPIRLED